MQGFKEFLLRGNLIELAVAFIMGAAFSTVVSSFTDLFMSIISRIIGGEPNFDAVTIAGIAVGPFITALINFVLVAAVIYFLIVKPMNAWRDRKKVDEEPPAKTDLELLTEIRDLLATGNTNKATEA